MTGPETPEPNEGWTPLLPVNDLLPNKPRRVVEGGLDLLLYRTPEEIFALSNQCTHQGAPLNRGVVKTGALKTVTCAAHGSMFGLADGRVLRGPAVKRLAVYDVRVNEGVLEVRERPSEQPPARGSS